MRCTRVTFSRAARPLLLELMQINYLIYDIDYNYRSFIIHNVHHGISTNIIVIISINIFIIFAILFLFKFVPKGIG